MKKFFLAKFLISFLLISQNSYAERDIRIHDPSQNYDETRDHPDIRIHDPRKRVRYNSDHSDIRAAHPKKFKFKHKKRKDRGDKKKESRKRPQPPHHDIRQMVEELPANKRKAFHAEMRRHRQVMKDIFGHEMPDSPPPPRD